MSATMASALKPAGPVPATAFYAQRFGDRKRPFDVAAELSRSVRLEEWLRVLDAEAVVSECRPRFDRPLISVVLPMFNASRWIQMTLKSLLVQDENIEIFCVDDASTDDTYDLVKRRFGADGRVCVARLERNVGPYQIRNWVAARLARGEWLAFQDADDLSHPNRFSVQKEHLRRRGATACGSCVHQVFPGGLTPRRGDTVARERDGMFHSLSFYFDVPRAVHSRPLPQLLTERGGAIYLQDDNGVVRVPVNDSPALYPTLMVRRDVFLSLGGFDGRATIHADKSFATRLARFYAIANVPAVLYTRNIHSQSLTQRPDTGYESSLRRNYILALQEKDRAVCRALERNDWRDALELCTSDLYHADIVVEEWTGHFVLPGSRTSKPGHRTVPFSELTACHS